jgi:dGTPase
VTGVDPAYRHERRDRKDRPQDQRTPGQRDRDRIMNTSAFRRLAGVTQVVSAAEGHVFHNRLTHSLEVAQIGRRIAERLLDKERGVANQIGGIDPEIVEGAALAHDLGHPPFGHIAEQELDALLIREGVSDGFEGNPQTFRVLTRLSVRSVDFVGLNLTRASHDAVMKYPWALDPAAPEKNRKWGYYSLESVTFSPGH